ncbi:TIM barrel protein, partial [Pseudactinotalea sp. HY160]|uniref:PQQ-dependent sugar dehydrogenase n=1 Tax=Pseudactinotalea sp. HY160 TaxID=2654490 RepID=UPI00128E775A
MAAGLVLPLAISGASAHPGHDGDTDPAGTAALAAEDPALEWDNYEKILLTKNTGEPIDLAVLPDSRVLHTARDGVVRLTDPSTGLTREVADIDVYNNSEDGLQGIALDPDFEENNWVYLVYAPRVMAGTSPTGVAYPETTPQGSAPEQLPDGADADTYWDQWLGYNVLSRFQWDGASNTLDLTSEQEIIKITAQRGQCCHVGADIAFDGDGNLYLSSGDNTPAGTPGANGFTPINNAPGMNPGFDSRRGAGNSNDLRGSILRIDVLDQIAQGAEPGPGSTYDIPAGNLFDSPEYDPDLVREEIYVTGLRNPFRMDYDLESGALMWGDYGPDSGSAQADRGPMGYVEWQVTTEPMNGGWPYCHGPNDGGAYNEWDYETGTPGEFFDCAAPVNNSTWNTGLTELPAVTQPQIWYGDNAGDQPWDEFVTFSSRGGQAPMGGPVFRYDETNPSPTQFPEYWDGKAFMAEFSQDYVAAIEMDELSSAGEVTGVTNFLPSSALYEQAAPEWSGIMDMEFGPDGSLYVLEYGKGFFRQNPEAGIYRIDYNPENKTPRPAISVDKVSGSDAPLDVTFDASGSFDPEGEALTYEWDFDGDGVIDDQGETITHTYSELGQYKAILRVTDPEGLFGLAVQQITVGNTAPEITLDVDDGSFFDWGDSVDITVSVTDAEDGDTPDCARVGHTFGLGHDQHAHPEVTGTGCEFTIQTSESAKDHGAGEKIFGTLVVSYTDDAQGDVPATTGEATLILTPTLQEAEWYDTAEGITVVNDAGASGGSYVTEFDDGDSLTFSPIAFTHAPSGEVMDSVTATGTGTGTISLGWNDEPAPFAELAFTGADGWQSVEAALETVPAGSGSLVVTSTGGVDLDSLAFHSDAGQGPAAPVCANPGAEISADDEFDGDEVDACRWDIIDYDPALAGVSDGAYRVTTVDADINGTVNEPVPNILRSTVVEGDEWTVETKFNSGLSSQWHQAGIMVYADPDNYVKVDPVFAADTAGNEAPLRLEIRSEVNGQFQQPEQADIADLPLSENGDYYVRLSRSGDTFTGAFSYDGQEWTDLPGSVTHNGLGDAGPGLFTVGKSQSEPTEVAFDYFRVVDEVPVEPVVVPVDRVSIQLYSLIPWVNADGLESVLGRLGSIGLENIEPYGGNYSGYTAGEFRALADANGLSVPSSHYNVSEGNFDQTLAYVSTVGQEYVGSGGFPSPGIGTYENTLATAEAMNRLGQRSVEAGVGKFFGHNHAGEFTTTYEHEGEVLSAWEILVRETDPEFVTFQVDVGWAAHAGVDVPTLLETYGDRIDLLHIKDAINLGGPGSPQFTNLGEGDVPLQAILAAALEADIAYYVMEYDLAPQGEEFVTTGFEYLTGLEAGEPEPPAEVLTETSVTTRCVAGRQVLVASVTNVAGAPLDVSVETAFGTRSVVGLADGATKSLAFTTRSVAIDGGELTVDATGGDGLDGQEVLAY